jgi:curved DNA-binding protein CbpA
MESHTQVLSDEKLRANYDMRGRDGVAGSPKMDSATLFAMIFGSEKFEPLVGKYGVWVCTSVIRLLLLFLFLLLLLSFVVTDTVVLVTF